jgi:hypothetical protein
MAKTYQEEIAEMQRQRAAAEQAEVQWRRGYQQEDFEGHLNDIAAEYNEALQLRNEAWAAGDEEEAKYHDRVAVRLFTEYNELNPPPPPPPHPDTVELAYKNDPWLKQHGQRGAQVADRWHRYWEARGVRPGHPQYKEMMRSSLEMYGEKAGTPFDRGQELPTPEEAMQMASAKHRITPADYNAGVAAMRAGKIGRG